MRLADVTPTHCSACFTQRTSDRHVDFEAAWDGPTVPGAQLVSIDDLVLCESCLREAAALVGCVDNSAAAARVQEAEDRARELAERLAGATDYIARLEQAQESRGRLEAALRPVQRQEGSAGARAKRKPAAEKAVA